MTKEELARQYSDEVMVQKRKNGLTITVSPSIKDAFIAGYEALEALIEEMKCCANCIFSESDRLNGTFCHKEGCFVLASAKCKLWEN